MILITFCIVVLLYRTILKLHVELHSLPPLSLSLSSFFSEKALSHHCMGLWPIFHAVVRSPYYFQVPQVGGVGFYKPQFPNMFLPGAVHINPRPENQASQERIPEAYSKAPHPAYHHDHHATGTGHSTAGLTNMNSPISHETLQLFPLHPTGILEERSGSTLTSTSAESESMDDGQDVVGGENQPPIDFFLAPRKPY